MNECSRRQIGWMREGKARGKHGRQRVCLPRGLAHLGKDTNSSHGAEDETKQVLPGNIGVPGRDEAATPQRTVDGESVVWGQEHSLMAENTVSLTRCLLLRLTPHSVPHSTEHWGQAPCSF